MSQQFSRLYQVIQDDLTIIWIYLKIGQTTIKSCATDAEEASGERAIAPRSLKCLQKSRLLIQQRISGNDINGLINFRRQIVGLDHRTGAMNHGKFNGASELAHIPRPKS